ncbi:hypothetical protein [Nitrosomonas ureae]|uniref:Pentapeptide MXKDX repeat protein n=1 Tax=Nitrosomonas ureae TaxID=44577 RepID=A0A1H9GWZ1_9PROT|nr:hypothetical protein [Nitrosomonas ureae]PTQ83200.1 hypothetical protein C8R28_10242 [Nitrosomonas ureae]SEQ54611.1 hypothetical protein SAMN05421510_10802 [Nitrosomonas ureae]
MMKILLTTIVTGFLFVSASTFAGDYSQTQNKVDDKVNVPQKAQSDQKDAETNMQNNSKNEAEQANNKDTDNQRKKDFR